MKGWEEVKLGEIAVFRNGLNFKNESHGLGCKIIGIPDFGDRLIPDYKNLGEINPVGIVKEDDFLELGDIIFVRSNGNKNLVGRSLFINEKNFKIVYSGFCIRARFINKNTFPLFYAYFFRTSLFRKLISGAAGGANIQNLNQGILSRSIVPVPPIPTQRRIASILSAYDDLIENNLKRIKLLEELAQRTYEEWFVKFKVNGKQLEVKEETGLPEGWERKKLKDVANLTMGQSPKSEFYNKEMIGLPFHQGVSDYGFRFPNNSTWSSEGNRFAEKGDILFSVRAPVGRLNVAIEKIILGRGLAAIRHKLGFTNSLFYQLQKIFFKDDLMGGGAIFNSVTKNDVERIEIIDAPKKIMALLNNYTNVMDDQIENLAIENRLLKESRDILLPRLMNGAINIEDVEEELYSTAAEDEEEYYTKKFNYKE